MKNVFLGNLLVFAKSRIFIYSEMGNNFYNIALIWDIYDSFLISHRREKAPSRGCG